MGVLVEREASEKLWGSGTAELDYRDGRVCGQYWSWQAYQLRRFAWLLWLLSGFGVGVGVGG